MGKKKKKGAVPGFQLQITFPRFLFPPTQNTVPRLTVGL